MSEQVPPTPWRKAISSFKRFRAIFVYLWGLLAIFNLHKSLILSQADIPYGQSFAVVNAFVLAKLIFFAEEFGFGERYNGDPLVYGMVFKAALYSVLLAGFEVLESVAVGPFRGRSVADSLAEVGGETLFGLVTTTLLVFFALLPFFGFRELCQVIGEDELYELLFRARFRLGRQEERPDAVSRRPH